MSTLFTVSLGLFLTLPLLGQTEQIKTADETVRIVFVGDIMLDRLPGKYTALGKNPFGFVAPILKAADLRIGNLECVASHMGTSVTKHYTFKANPKVLDTVVGHLDAVSLANNHTGDFGHSALLDTFSQLDNRNIQYFGAGINFQDAHAPLILEKKGIKIALLGYNEFRPRTFEAGPTTPGVAWSEDKYVVKDIEEVRDKVDLVITFMHWGEEYVSHPNERQKNLARKMIDAGADVVVGNHSHITEGAETYKGKLIVYSLGNFIFDDYADSYRESRLELREISRTSWMLDLKMNRKGLVEWNTYVTRTGDDGFPRLVKGAESPGSTKAFPVELLNPLVKTESKALPVVPLKPCTESALGQRCVNGKLEYVDVEAIKLQTTSLDTNSKPVNDMIAYQLDKQYFMDADLKPNTQVKSHYSDEHCELTQLDFNTRFEYPDPDDIKFSLKSVELSKGKKSLFFPIQNSFRDAPRSPFDDVLFMNWMSQNSSVVVKGITEPKENSFTDQLSGIRPFTIKADKSMIPGKDYHVRISGLGKKEKIRLSFAGYNTMKNLGYYVKCEFAETKNRSKHATYVIPAGVTSQLPFNDVPQEEIFIGVEAYHQKLHDSFSDTSKMVLLESNHRVSVKVPLKQTKSSNLYSHQ